MLTELILVHPRMQIPPLIDYCDLGLCGGPEVPKKKPIENLSMRKISKKH